MVCDRRRVPDAAVARHRVSLRGRRALLCALAGRDLAPRLLRDDRQRVRVVPYRPDFSDLLEVGLTQPRRYGAADPFVLARLFAPLRALACCVDQPAQRQAAAQDFDDSERSRLVAPAHLVEQAQSRGWTADPCSTWADR